MFKSALESLDSKCHGPYSQLNSFRNSNVFSCFLKFCTLSVALMMRRMNQLVLPFYLGLGKLEYNVSSSYNGMVVLKSRGAVTILILTWINWYYFQAEVLRGVVAHIFSMYH